MPENLEVISRKGIEGRNWKSRIERKEKTLGLKNGLYS